jgi:hypothetical protein
VGMVPIPVISPLTLTRLEEPVLEPPLPISRVGAESANTGAGADEGYSSSQQAPLRQDHSESETQPAVVASDPTHQVNIFA